MIDEKEEKRLSRLLDSATELYVSALRDAGFQESSARTWKRLAKHLLKSRNIWRDAALLSGESLDIMGYFDDPEIDALYSKARAVDAKGDS